MEEELKKIMGDAYKENMTSDEIQAFFKNQVLGSGTYVNREAAEAEKKKLQDALNAKDAELKNKMTDDEKKAAADKALQEQVELLQKQLLEGKITGNELKATSITAKTRLNTGVTDEDAEFAKFIKNISSDDETKTMNVANYVNTLVEKAYEKGKTDATKNKLGNMGKLDTGSNTDGNSNGKTQAEEIAERLAKGSATVKKEHSYFN